MEGITPQFFRNLKSFWHRRTYVKLQDPTSNKKRSAKLGTRNRRKHRSEKVRTTSMAFRVQIKIPSLTKLLVRLTSIYTGSMLKLAGEKRSLPPSEVAQRVREGLQVTGLHGKFERKMMVHIYNNLVAPKDVVV